MNKPLPLKQNHKVMPLLNYIDLFAGCGGLSTGLHLAGLNGLFAIEQNPMAFSTLKTNLVENRKHFNWPNWLPVANRDIKSLLKKNSGELATLRRKVDLVVGGPPCQGFSTAGRRNENDGRNHLFRSYLNFVELLQPRAIFFENVRGFTMKFGANTETGTTYSQLVIKKLRALGYNDARGELIDMADYGVPQRRQRYIVIATRENLADTVFSTLEAKSLIHLSAKGVSKRNTVKTALSDLERRHGIASCPDTRGFHSGIASRPKTGLQRYLRVDPSRHIPDSHRFVNHTEETESIFLNLLASAPRNRCLLGKEREPYGLKKRSVTVLDADNVSPTVTTIPDDFIHYCEPRVMTVRECARLQTFPDWFEFKGPYTTGGKLRATQIPRYTQVGNAVPPLFAELVGLALKEVLGDV